MRNLFFIFLVFLKVIQQQNNDEIKRLQNEITRVRGEHVNSMSRMKLSFQKELQQQRTHENAKVEGIRRQANQVLINLLFFRELKINSILRLQNNIFMIKQ
jgi:hypothetical protein